MWVCSGLQFVRFSIVMGLAFWLPTFLMADRGMSIAQAGLVMAMSAAISAPSTTLGAYVSDRLGNPPLVIGASLAALACAAALLPGVHSVPPLLLVIALYSVFQGFYFGPLFLVPMEILGPRVAGTATGFANLFANIGGFVTVYALGWIRDSTGSFAAGFAGISAMAIAGVVLTALLARVRRSMLDAVH
jgi:sugar phosphate permease